MGKWADITKTKEYMDQYLKELNDEYEEYQKEEARKEARRKAKEPKKKLTLAEFPAPKKVLIPPNPFVPRRYKMHIPKEFKATRRFLLELKNWNYLSILVLYL